MSAQKRRLDLDTLLDKKEKVYVKNGTLKSQLFLVIEMKDKNGKNRALKVPPVEFPICVSTQFSEDSIRESTDLRDAIGKGVLVLVEPEEAEKMLATADAKEQFAAFSMSPYADSAPQNAVRDSMERMNNENESVIQAKELLSRQKQDDSKISPKVKGTIVSFQSKEKSSKDTLLQLKRMKPVLTESDLTYIISQCKSETTIREFAESTLAELSAVPEQPFES